LAASFLVFIGAASRTQTGTFRLTQDSHRQIEHYLLCRQSLNIQLVVGNKHHIQITRTQLDLLVSPVERMAQLNRESIFPFPGNRYQTANTRQLALGLHRSIDQIPTVHRQDSPLKAHGKRTGYLLGIQSIDRQDHLFDKGNRTFINVG